MKKLIPALIILGIASIFLINALPVKLSTIKEIKSLPLNSKIKIQGELIDYKLLDKATNFQQGKIKDQTGVIDFVCNCDLKQNKNKNIELSGRLQEYKSNLQISADKITYLN